MKKLAILLVLLAGAAAALAAYTLYAHARTPFKGYAESERFVEIPLGASSKGVGDRLIAAGVIESPLLYRVALWISGDARRLQAGEYRFDRPMTPFEVIDKIARGDVYLLSMTVPEGLNVAEVAKIVESHGLGTAARFIAAARDKSLIASIDPDAPDLEGYLFPDTYRLPRQTNESQLVRAMVDRFMQVLIPELRQAAAARGLSVRRLVTLASIVEKETAQAEERPIVAAVYSNRLKVGMGLQCDPTVIYALTRAGLYKGNLRRDDLHFDSPYNTYVYSGLPPGPIAAPGKESLYAAAHPADVDYLYFVSRNDGTHVFARTLTEHNENVRRYQVQFFRDRRARPRP